MVVPLPPPHIYGMQRAGIPHETHILLELIYAALIILACIIIYAKTKEFYKLTKHRGIQFFRQTFLFFGMAFLLRLIPLLFQMSQTHIRPFRFGFLIGMALFSYASSMAIINIARSLIWKKTQHTLFKQSWPYQGLALLTSILVFLTHSRILFFFLQTGLVIITILLMHTIHTPKKKQSSVHIMYLLILLFWTVNIAIVSMPRFMNTMIYSFYGLSLVVFWLLLRKVLKITKGT